MLLQLLFQVLSIASSQAAQTPQTSQASHTTALIKAGEACSEHFSFADCIPLYVATINCENPRTVDPICLKRLRSVMVDEEMSCALWFADAFGFSEYLSVTGPTNIEWFTESKPDMMVLTYRCYETTERAEMLEERRKEREEKEKDKNLDWRKRGR